MITNFYFPANVQIFDHDQLTNKLTPTIGWEGWWEDLLPDINDAIDHYCEDMSDYIDDESFEEKVESIFYSMVLAGEDNDIFYGKVTIEHSSPFTASEISDIKEWIEGQNSDGTGEGLACQQYMSHEVTFMIEFWSSINKHLYKIYSEDEWKEMLIDV